MNSNSEVSLVMMLSERHRAVRRAEGRSAVGYPRIGTVTVVPPGCPTSFAIEGAATVLLLDLTWTELCRWAAEDHELDPARIEIEPRLVHLDPVLARQFCLAAAGVEHEEETLRAIGGRLLESHAGRSVGEDLPAKGGLAPNRLRRVLEKVEAELEQPLALGDLAAEVSMSAFHFARAFRQTTGIAPHQYLLQRRLARAVVLLADPETNITHVAAEAGFSHPSHLARHLRRFTGLAPNHLRSALFGG